ncbi:MAG: hybrid sensor histidine kinase/response regulator [Bacteroidota bacterium]|nr:hybrid sensor histidine kinase/response regulator [Bacteroidota bacterium]
MTHKILLVDDRPENIFVLEQIINSPDRELLKANSGNEALKIAYKNLDISLILLDVQMPDMDGFEVAEFLKSNTKTSNIPIIFVTAISKEKKYVVRGLEEGAIDYLFKPLDPQITSAKVSTLLRLKEQQQMIQSQNEELLKLNEEKNYLLGMAAHDLRNPLNGIIGFSSMLMGEIYEKLDEDQKTMLELIQTASNNMLNIINDLLDVSKIEAGKLQLHFKETDIVTLIRNNVHLNGLIAEKKNIRLTYNGPIENIILKVDPARFAEIIDNLLSNAIKYSHSDTDVTLSLTTSPDKIVIAVSDQGQGIVQEELRQLFQPFKKARGVKSTAGEQSTGLGLAIVKKIVEAHQGNISAESEVGKGSTFTVTLPCSLN